MLRCNNTNSIIGEDPPPTSSSQDVHKNDISLQFTVFDKDTRLSALQCYTLVAFHCGTGRTYCVKSLMRVTGWMLNLAEVQTTDALYTNESIHFNNRSPIWHQGPSSRLYPGRGSHSCFRTVVHCKLSGPRVSCFDPIWPRDKGRLSARRSLKNLLKGTRSELSEEFSTSSRWFALQLTIWAWTMLEIGGGIYLLSSLEP